MDKIDVNVADAMHHQVIWCGKCVQHVRNVYNMYVILIVVNCGPK